MDSGPCPPRRSFVGPVILICIGTFFLAANLLPNFNPWETMFRYWPVILILIGLGQVWDYFAYRRNPSRAGHSDISGVVLAVVMLIVLLGLVFWRQSAWPRAISGSSLVEMHASRTIDLGGATSVIANLRFPAGQVDLSGGADHLLDADFRYNQSRGEPTVGYSVDSGRGQLDVSQADTQYTFGPVDEQWNLRLSDNVPLDLTLHMGVGRGSLNLNGLNLSRLEMHAGVGEMQVDLTGPRKQDLTATLDGGVGEAHIRLPRDVGVRVVASTGLGEIHPGELAKQGDAYVNSVYGKTPTSINLTVHGGIGEIHLDQE